jgi:hypothetical protein
MCLRMKISLGGIRRWSQDYFSTGPTGFGNIFPKFSLLLSFPSFPVSISTSCFCSSLGSLSLLLGVLETNKINFGSNRNKPKQDLFCVCFGLFCETKKKKITVCFGVSNLYRNNRNKQICFVTNRNNPKFSEKFPNILSFKLFGWV